jgi:hypothetical protein
MQIPARILEHPFESLLAGALLLMLLLGSTESGSDGASAGPTASRTTQQQNL